MDKKTLDLLEYPKILQKLAGYASFRASSELALMLSPTNKLELARERLLITREARHLLNLVVDFSIGGVRDVREEIDMSRRGIVLTPEQLLNVKSTLMASRDVFRVFEKRGEEFPLLKKISADLDPPPGLIDHISRVVSERAKVLDNASKKLSELRSKLKVQHERLINRMNQIVNNPKNAGVLQEAIYTQRSGRYVVPVSSNFKGRFKGIIHDQSSTGATLFIEPIEIVDINNEWQELQLEERNEIQRVLAELSATIGEHHDQLKHLVHALARLDLALMFAKYAEELDAEEPVLVPMNKPTDSHPGCVIELRKARHPLLDQGKAVPINVVLDENTFSLVITGPNTGGKTVTLKTVGLLIAMAQSGFHIPVQSGTTFSIFKNLFADIGDEQSIEQSLSTFSGHITNIVRILKRADRETLVLFDELGAGTDPQDGAALAQAILTHLVQHAIPNMVATHYPELKTFAHATEGTVNASMEFDSDTLQPTYHLTIGLPGRSNALLIAEKYGLSSEIISMAKAQLPVDEIRTEDLLDEIQTQRQLALRERDEAEAIRREAETLRAELKVRLTNIESERQSLVEETRESLQKEMEELRTELNRIRRKITSRKEYQELKAEAEEIAEEIKSVDVKKEIPPEEEAPAPEPLKVGERVRIVSLGMNGEITAIEDDEVEIQAGALRMKASVLDLQRVNKAGKPKEENKKVTRPSRVVHTGSIQAVHPSPGMELDLRGSRVDEGLDRLESYLEDAWLAGLPFVRIIHGKGTGKLRTEVRKALRRSKKVKSWQRGLEGEGGEGVSVVHLNMEDSE